MSYKNFSSAQTSPREGVVADKSKEAPATAQPAVQPEKAPNKVAPVPKP